MRLYEAESEFSFAAPGVIVQKKMKGSAECNVLQIDLGRLFGSVICWMPGDSIVIYLLIIKVSRGSGLAVTW